MSGVDKFSGADEFFYGQKDLTAAFSRGVLNSTDKFLAEVDLSGGMLSLTGDAPQDAISTDRIVHHIGGFGRSM